MTVHPRLPKTSFGGQAELVEGCVVKPFILREPQDERFFPKVLSEVEGRAQYERLK